MNKCICMLLTICHLATIAVFIGPFSSMTVGADETVSYVEENYDNDAGNARLKGWVIAPNQKGSDMYGEVADDPEGGGNKVFKLVRGAGGNIGVRAERSFDEPLKGMIAIEYRLWYDSTEKLQHVGELTNAYSETCFQLMIGERSYTVKNGGMANEFNRVFTNVRPAKEEWHTFKYVIDTENSTYSLTINDIKAAENFGMANSTIDGLSSFFFINAIGTMCIDDVSIYKMQDVEPDYGRITSKHYTIDSNNNIIDDVEYETTVDRFLGNITFAEGAEYELYGSDGVLKKTDEYIENDDELVVASQDGSDKAVYTMKVKHWKSSFQLTQIVKDSVILFVGNSEAIVANKKVRVDKDNKNVMPTIVEGRTLVPVRFISESFGAEIDWNPENSEITIVLKGKTIKMVIGRKDITVDNVTVQLDVAPTIIEGRTYIPLRAMAEAIGKKLYWDDRGLIIINDQGDVFNTIAKQPWIDELIERFGVETIPRFNFECITVPEKDQNPGKEFYVANDGNDSNNGSKEAPFATLEGAKKAIRELKKGSLPAGGVNVYLRDGKYILDKSFELTKEDSGTESAPIRYMNYPGEQPRIQGSVTLNGSDFKLITDSTVLKRISPDLKDKIYQFDLKTIGMKEFDPLKWIGMGRPYDISPNMLYFNGRGTTLARWPNENIDMVRLGRVHDPGSIPRNRETPDRGFEFEYRDPRPEGWQDIKDAWINGYFLYGYAESNTSLESIDKTKKTLKTTYPSRYGAMAGREYYYYNILEELDLPGEWYLDRKTGIVYLYPTGDIKTADIQFSTLKTNIFEMNEVSNVTLRGLTLEGSRANGINVTGGENINIDNCLLRHFGDAAIKVSGGKKHNITNNCVYDTGTMGMSVTGGDRQTLTPSEHNIESNNIFEFQKILFTYNPGIDIGGVGNRVAHNLIHGARQQAIKVIGGGVDVEVDGIVGEIVGANDITIEYNDIYDVLEPHVHDSGAIYTFGDHGSTNIVIRYNFLHHISKKFNGYIAVPAIGIYLDGSGFGYSIYGNVFYNVPWGVQHGNHLNKTTRNIFIDCVQPLSLWQSKYELSEYFSTLKGLIAGNPKWLQRYPHLSELDDTTEQNIGYDVSENIMYKCDKGVLNKVSGFDASTNLTINSDIGFVEEESMDFRLKESSQVFKLAPGFENIPMEKIGLK